MITTIDNARGTRSGTSPNNRARELSISILALIQRGGAGKEKGAWGSGQVLEKARFGQGKAWLDLAGFGPIWVRLGFGLAAISPAALRPRAAPYPPSTRGR